MYMRTANTTNEAIAILKFQVEQGINVDSYTYVDVLKRCLKEKDLRVAREVHHCIIKSKMEQDKYVASSLLSVYIRCGSLQDARQVFDALAKKSVINWNIMIGGYVQHNRGKDARQLFHQMRQEHVQADKITYLSILKACASPLSLKWGREVHVLIRRDGLESDIRVGTALIQMYAKCGSIEEARQAFDNLTNRNVVSWTAMVGANAGSGRGVEAYDLYLKMKEEGFQPNAVTYMSLLNDCASTGALEWVKDVHRHILEGGYESDVRVGNALVHMYAKSGSIEDAAVVFDWMKQRDLITWNAMIGAYAGSGRGVEAYDLYLKMKEEGFQPDAVTYMSLLNDCASTGALEWVKDVHRHILEGGYESDVRVGNALVHMYAKSGSIEDAAVVFDRMKERDLITWTVMIGACAGSGRGVEAYDLYLKMKEEGFQPNAVTYMSLLNDCASTGALEWVKDVHRHILEGGHESDIRVGNALVHMYAKSGSTEDAAVVFDRMEERDLITWNAMIGAYAGSGRGVKAYDLYVKMKEEGFQPDAVTYMSLLNDCASTEALDWVKDVHRHILEGGYESDVRVGSALIHMYAKCGSTEDAAVVFDRMEERDQITWNVMIGAYAGSGRGVEAYDLYLKMKEEGFQPDAVTYVSLLNDCASTGALEWVKDVHRHILEGGHDSDIRVGNALVHMYAKSGSIEDAAVVFDRMKERNIITWTVMIGACGGSGRGVEAYDLYLKMKEEGFQPNAVTYMSLLNDCASTGALEWVKDVHRHILEGGYESDVRVGNALVHMYAKSGSIDDAALVFDWMKERDLITWNAMIGAYAGSGRGVEAYDLYLKMKEEGFQPNAVTYVSLLTDCASTGALEWVKDVHRHILEGGYESDVRVGNGLVRMYVKSGSIENAAVVFDRMKERNIITWTVMIGAYAGSGRGVKAYDLYLKMKEEGFQPDAVTYVSLLNDCAITGALEWVKDVHRHILEGGHESDVRVGSALVRMYAKSGSIEDAQLVFERMEEFDVMTWNIMIRGLGQHGRGQDALKLFRKMKADGLVPVAYSFVALLSACSHAGLVDEGRQVFCAMKDYGVEPTVVHYSCMVDLLGRAGLLEEAKRFISSMPVEADAGTWGALLGACRTYGNVELGEFAAKEVLKLEPAGASPYVLLSNIYAAAGQWDQVSFIRHMMQERGIRKEPGVSWIEISNKVHRFVVGDRSHPEAKKIYDVLNNLSKTLKAEGYIPDTRLVLRNIDEEQKVHALCAHSERLAIAYGLMHTPRGMPIRVFKNLRVCSDCHTATGFISKVTGREIVTRDANRFHHFKDGVCSCGDYW